MSIAVSQSCRQKQEDQEIVRTQTPKVFAEPFPGAESPSSFKSLGSKDAQNKSARMLLLIRNEQHGHQACKQKREDSQPAHV